VDNPDTCLHGQSMLLELAKLMLQQWLTQQVILPLLLLLLSLQVPCVLQKLLQLFTEPANLPGPQQRLHKQHLNQRSCHTPCYSRKKQQVHNV
jgi:hypothetical protein